jgi:hypothetical protein
MNMTTILSVLAIMSGAFSLVLPYITTALPQLGPWAVYRLRELLWANLLVAFALALGAYVLDSSTTKVLILILSVALAGMGVLFTPKRIFVALANPPRESASLTQLDSNSRVVGFEIDVDAVAWPFDMIYPHHLINDRLGDLALLVAY